jgi:hypothetical protein
MKRLIYLGLFVLILAGLSSCESRYDYYVAGLNKTNMSGYHSFAWMPMGNTKASTGGSQVADATIKDAATASLASKGLTLQQRNPDLLVSYSTMIGQGTRTYYYPNYGYDAFYPGFGFGWGGWGGWGGYGGWGRWGYRPYYYAYGDPFIYGGGGVGQEHYKEGTIIIDLIDVRTKKVVWRGFGVGEVHHNPQKDMEDLPKVVSGVLEQLHVNPTVNSYRRGMRPNNNNNKPVYTPASTNAI